MKIPKFLTDLFQENDGKWSLSRFTSASMVLSAIVWISYVIIKSSPHVLPDMTGPSIWAGGGATHYGLGKWFGKKDDDAADRKAQ